MGIVMQVYFRQPQFTTQQAVTFARELYGIDATADPLPSERDQNFHLITTEGQSLVLKIANESELQSVLDLQNQAMKHVAKHASQLHVPHVCTAKDGSDLVTIYSKNKTAHFLRILTYVPGKPLACVKPHASKVLTELGRFLGELDRTLGTFTHPAAQRELKWNMASADWILQYLENIRDSQKRNLVEHFYKQYDLIQSQLRSLRAHVIYNDANDYNVLIDANRSGALSIGAIDFGDMIHTQVVCEPAIAAAYCMLHKPDPLGAAIQVVAGYHQTYPLTEQELEVLFPVICVRLCTSVTNAAYQRSAAPANDYLTISETPAWQLLEKLAEVNADFAHFRFRHACGYSASPSSSRVFAWLQKERNRFAPLLKHLEKSTVVDLTVGSPIAGNLGEIEDTAEFSRRITKQVKAAQSTVGIGRYNEARVLCKDPAFSVEGNDGPEWRTIHLGIDLFVESGSLVFVPLDGELHSFRNNASRHDYGPTIILQHTIDDGSSFFTLYGHLSLDSLDDLSEGKRFRKGSVLGRVGASTVNGGWPPHLHFQIIQHLFGRKGDFPGNARPSEREFWNDLCPDPNLIAQITHSDIRTSVVTKDDLLALRSMYTGKSLSIAYEDPLHIVCGSMQYLYDSDGRAYLDAVNNVAHVGHCHPYVVRAGKHQMDALNTNTRYLHQKLLSYVERLTSTLPEPLRVCFLVNSGSEANELALRLARTFTNSKDVIVMEGGYHGNTGGLIEVSSYKFDGPGGSGAPPYVHKVPLPDTYRGTIRKTDPDAGKHYARFVGAALQQISEAKKRCAAFLCEPMPSCGGQIILPDGYLREAYELVRKAGAVCIADEVQTGFGRPGTCFWAFETQGVIPDIVTMGKPIGNGHPLGAVITTREIADAFSNGMEYFSTFGGNPVSCAIGLAVLDVITNEQLQENAKQTGAYLMHRLLELQHQHPLIGDVRGSGLYLGVELVTDRATLAPAHKEAGYIINRMRNRGILLSTDGALHNVIKIKPPLIFGEQDADFLVHHLGEVLQENLESF